MDTLPAASLYQGSKITLSDLEWNIRLNALNASKPMDTLLDLRHIIPPEGLEEFDDATSELSAVLNSIISKIDAAQEERIEALSIQQDKDRL